MTYLLSFLSSFFGKCAESCDPLGLGARRLHRNLPALLNDLRKPQLLNKSPVYTVALCTGAALSDFKGCCTSQGHFSQTWALTFWRHSGSHRPSNLSVEKQRKGNYVRAPLVLSVFTSSSLFAGFVLIFALEPPLASAFTHHTHTKCPHTPGPGPGPGDPVKHSLYLHFVSSLF